MPRALSLQRTVVPRNDRERFRKRVEAMRAHYAKANCKYWVFEEAGLPGAFLECFEAKDSETLAQAHAEAPARLLDPSRIYHEVEF